MTRRLALGSACALFALTTAAAAHAQDTTPASPAAEVDDSALQEITVTAERREANLRDVPISVGVVAGAQLREFQQAGEDILALSGRVPGLYAETTTGRIFPRFYIRGLGNIDFYLGASQPVSIVQDEVVLEHVVLKSNPVFDVAQVEVLRGPQGSLFGRNTTAGIIKFDTIKPSNVFSGRGQVSVGEYGTVNADVGIGGPIAGDKLSARFSALVQHREDWVDNSYTGPSADGTPRPLEQAMGGFDDRNLRVQLLGTPSEAVRLLLSGHYRDYVGTSTLFRRAALTRGSNDVSGVVRDQVRYDEAMNNPQAYETYGGSLNASFDVGGLTLTSITAYESASGYSRGDTDGGAAADFPVGGVANGFGQSQGNLRDLDQWTQEVRLADNQGRFKWQVGGLYFDSRDTTDFYQRAFFLTTAARNPNNWVRLRNVNTSWAAFGQASFDVTDALTITAGGRITEDRKRTRLLKTADTAAGVVTYRGRTDVELDATEPSWDVSALYRIDDQVSLYARVARGFRGPTIQGRSAVFNSDFTTADSETILSWEAGAKSSLFDNRLRLNATGFYYTVSDIQLNGNDSDGNGVLFNADKAKVYGVEVEVDARPVRNLSLTAGFSALHSEIQDDRVFAQVCALNGRVVCNVGDPTITVATAFGPAVFAQIDGNPLPNAPRWNLNLAARYDVPLAGGDRFFVSTDWNVQGYTSFVLYKSDEFTSNGNFEGGARIGYALPGDAFEFSVFARNITNEKNLKGVIENFMAAVVNEPRVIGVSLAGRF
ncbi:TonB-dependent receptor [Sphingomonas spermidinifaciens]|uniref:TonB-dependent receptor n=1 Tax=Sphingomonas spermidinifaciens TaxID=1141889 RepID=A0A2A4BA20_9SPHN|nr:TonB-dependent receptor [Sphingomonas spermidinifaciens]PCD04648.1 TonB-dependent receptor [Sphingomonas spermidinifaciens]